jgi:hypothetical protein
MPLCTNISALRAYNNFTDVVFLQGYSLTGDGGEGLFYWDSADNTSPDNDGTIIKVTGMSSGRWKRLYSESLNVKWFGAKGNDINNDQPSLQKAIDAAQTLKQSLRLPAGNYYIASGLIVGNIGDPFITEKITGAGRMNTKITYDSTVAGFTAMKVIGGSGGLTSGYLKDIAFVDKSSDKNPSVSTAIEVAGKGGYRIINCAFDRNKLGIYLHNRVAKEFTEYVVAERCDFTVECLQSLRYYNEPGADSSFHGSGLSRCTVNIATLNTLPVVTIDGSAYPYNAPMDLQVWSLGSGQTVIQNNSSRIAQLHGAITFEGGYGPVQPDQSDACKIFRTAAAQIFYLGTVQGITWFNLGDVTLTDVLDVTGSTTGNLVRYNKKPQSKTIILNPGDNDTGINVGEFTDSDLLRVSFQAPNFDWRDLLCGTHDGYGAPSGYVNMLAAIRHFNAFGYQAPVYTVNALGNLIISMAGIQPATIQVIINLIPLAKVL